MAHTLFISVFRATEKYPPGCGNHPPCYKSRVNRLLGNIWCNILYYRSLILIVKGLISLQVSMVCFCEIFTESQFDISCSKPTLRAKSRWTASLVIASFIRLQHLHCFFADFQMESFPSNSCIQMQFPLPTPCFNVALKSGVRPSPMWINIDNWEQGKPLVSTPQWSNTFGLIV